MLGVHAGGPAADARGRAAALGRRLAQQRAAALQAVGRRQGRLGVPPRRPLRLLAPQAADRDVRRAQLPGQIIDTLSQLSRHGGGTSAQCRGM